MFVFFQKKKKRGGKKSSLLSVKWKVWVAVKMMLCILKAGSLSRSFNLHSWERPVISPPQKQRYFLFRWLHLNSSRLRWSAASGRSVGRGLSSLHSPAVGQAVKLQQKRLNIPKEEPLKRKEEKRQRATKRLAGSLHIEHQVIEVCTHASR